MQGLVLMWDLKRDENAWAKGHIVDPKDGKIYGCKLEVSPDGKTLSVRGYMGLSLFGRTQKWQRAE